MSQKIKIKETIKITVKFNFQARLDNKYSTQKSTLISVPAQARIVQNYNRLKLN